MNNMIAIYGAMSVALGIERAFARLYPEKKILGYVVSKRQENLSELDGFPVMTIEEFSENVTDKEKVTVDWKNEEKYMTELYTEEKIFPSVHELKKKYSEKVQVFVAQSCKDMGTKISMPKREWLFPILEKTEELSNPKGAERSDRYIGYLGENLATLYFLHNADKLKIYHTGRVMLV